MKRLVLLLLVGLGWAAVRRLGRAGSASAASRAYPFPTATSHAAIAIDSDMAAWCSELGCSQTELQAAIDTVGRSVDAVRDHLARRAAVDSAA